MQHALRAYTPLDQKAVKVAAQTFRVNPDFDTEEVITQLRTGEALLSFLDENGAPGVVVADTHCIRIAGLLGLTDGTKDPAKVEAQLRACLPPEESNDFCHRMVLHGRAVCRARRPDCARCALRPWCDHFQKEDQAD